jgi:glycosyltransferase involved in cell wall biosynthesis
MREAEGEAGLARGEKSPPGEPHVVALLSHDRLENDPRVASECQVLVQAGYTVTVICWSRSGKHARNGTRDGYRVVYLGARTTYSGGVRQLPAYLWFALEALSWLLRNRYAAIHCHDFDTVPMGWVAGKLRRKPVVFDAHEAYPDMQRNHSRILFGVTYLLEKFLAPRCSRIVTVGELIKDRFVKLTRGRVPVRVVGSWKDPKEFCFPETTLATTRVRLGIPQDDLVVGFFGGLNSAKPVLPLLEAAKRVGGVSVILAGEGEHGALVRSWAERHSWVHYLGFIPWSEVRLYTSLCHALYYGLNTSFPEAIYSSPNTLFSAIAAGKPCLTVDYGELGRVVRETGCGYLMAELNDRECEAGIRFLQDSSRRRALEKAACIAGKIYCTSEAGRRLVALYAGLTQER